MGDMPDRARSPQPTQRSRRRLAEVFGEVLPETTADERPDHGVPDSMGSDPTGRAAEAERWYQENRPPHHG